MSAPPVPPRPLSPQSKASTKPPLPPLPPNFRPDIDGAKESPPHFADPLVAPRPQKLLSSVPADMARSLEAQVGFPAAVPIYSSLHAPPPPPDAYRRQSPVAPNYYPPAGFYPPPRLGPSPAPGPAPYGQQPVGWNTPPSQPTWNPALSQPPQQQQPVWNPPQQQQQQQPQQQQPVWNSPPQQQQQPQQSQSAWNSSQPLSPPAPQWTSPQVSTQGASRQHTPLPYGALSNSLASLSFNEPTNQHSPPRQQSPPASAPPALTASFPTIASLTTAMPSVVSSIDPAKKVAWAKDVFTVFDKSQQLAGATASNQPAHISDPALVRLTDAAIQIVITLAAPPVPNPIPVHVAEAFYLRGTLASTGAFPTFFPQSPRDAFRDFEASARAGYYPAWFKLGRDYENVGDSVRAKECYERGIKHNVATCFYRLGMAHLQGQLGLPANAQTAMPLLQRAANLANVDAPQPAYVYSLLLLSEFPQITLPPGLIQSTLPPAHLSTTLETRIQTESRKFMERAAYLGFSPAQFKLGNCYEYATAPFPYDPLMSVQYYSLASQNGEADADMALSKWFLCGAEGSFDKDEGLAYVFAEKAAKKGLASAEFALGYYTEVGIGIPSKDLDLARNWYQKAVAHGNAEAAGRLKALSQPQPTSLSRAEHETLTDNNLTRRRTQAKLSSAAAGRMPVSPQEKMPTVVETVRNSSLANLASTGGPPAQNGGGRPPRPSQQGEYAPSQQHPGSTGPRYSLSDSVAVPANERPISRPMSRPTSRPGSRPGTANGQPPRPAAAATTAPTTGTGTLGPKGPATFAEMGFTSHKLDEKECIVM